MPDSLLVFAFALTLVVNAVLIVVALRAMRPGGRLSDVPDRRREKTSTGTNDEASDEWRGPAAADESRGREAAAESRGRAAAAAPDLEGREPRTRPMVPSGAPTTAPKETATAAMAKPARARRRPDAASTDSEVPSARTPAVRDEAAASALSGGPDPAVPAPSRKRPARRSTASEARESANPQAGPKTRKPAINAGGAAGRRRRFSLPPLDDDGDRVNRSIETFLSGGDAPTEAMPPTDPEAGPPATTVALVALPEPRDATPADQSDGQTADPSADDPARVELAVTAVERELRAAARGTDHVDRVAPDRFRVVMASTGELAARAYLRRVRASVEPLLDELDPPRRLVVATGTVLGEPLVSAEQRAERRLAAILDAPDDGDNGDVDQPRAAPD